jgi:acyl-CoA thioester hydrolase
MKPDLPKERRGDYPHFLPLQTRWHDNDLYGHVNNVVYYAYFDTVINRYLIDEGGLKLDSTDPIGVCVESSCRYLDAVAFPDSLAAGLRVSKLGNSSVRYEIGIFRDGEETPRAVGWFVHVFVDHQTRKPVPLPERIRTALERLRNGRETTERVG